MPVSRFDKVLSMARRVKRFLSNPEKALRRRLRGQKNTLTLTRLRSKRQELKKIRQEAKSRRREEYKQLKRSIAKLEDELKGKKQEAKQVGKELLAADDPAQRSEREQRKQEIQQERARLKAELRVLKKQEREEKFGRKKRKKTAQQEIFRLERERRAAKERRRAAKERRTGGAPDTRQAPQETSEQQTGALPDFVIIGEKKCGTTYLYHLLSQHPLVEPAAAKELHFFDVHFDEGVEWYRQNFPPPKQKGTRQTMTGEATPYMAHRYAPERMAEVIPEARLIALLRNPVERAYSDYQQVARKGRETRTFEEAVRAAELTRLSGEEGGEDRDGSPGEGRHKYLARSIYVDQLERWAEHFPREQLLVLKSEDLFERPEDTLASVLGFLGLPEWEPEARSLRYKRNAGGYGGGMDPATRRKLEEYFEPHNSRLYEFLGRDLGW